MNRPPLIQAVLDDPAFSLKQKYQFFPTPESLVDEMSVWVAPFDGCDLLEPSAGHGHLLHAFKRASMFSDMEFNIECCELLEIHQDILAAQGYMVVHDDFMTYQPEKQYDRILANPPFKRNQDIDHIRHMFELLKPGGRLVSLSGTSWTFGSQKKQRAFRDWLEETDYDRYDYDQGVFKSVGAGVGGIVLVIDKD